jgi:hypothetical protein
MFLRIKYLFKKVLQQFGLYNPSQYAKITQAAKAEIILECKTPELRIFVETGTREGDMIDAVGASFTKIYSIELDKELYTTACARFDGRKDIKLIQGDSGVKIQDVLSELNEPALFWLDAHGDSVPVSGPNAAPIKKELEAIFDHPIKKHMILIDDVRHFDSEGISFVNHIAEKNSYNCFMRDGLFILSKK